MTPDQTTDLYDRAARIFGVSHDEIRWPYEANGLDRSLRRTEPERYRAELDAYDRQRLVIVEWAERYGLKASHAGCCPWWLTRTTSRRCPVTKCSLYGTGWRVDETHWLDHPIRWNKDGKPAAITASPYDDNMSDNERIKWWLGKDPRLRVAFGAGWYGPSTTQVVMWRSDRIPVIEPASSDGGWYELMRRSAQIAATPTA